MVVVVFMVVVVVVVMVMVVFTDCFSTGDYAVTSDLPSASPSLHPSDSTLTFEPSDLSP